MLSHQNMDQVFMDVNMDKIFGNRPFEPRLEGGEDEAQVDGDHGMSHESRESVTINGFTSYTLDRESTLTIENALDDDATRAAGNGHATFSSTLRGSKQDNPESAFALSRLQSRRSVSVLFENKSEFTATATERNYANPQGRNIFFTGASNLLCPRESSCSSYQCPSRFRQRQDAEFTICATRPCSVADEDLCCIEGNTPRMIILFLEDLT